MDAITTDSLTCNIGIDLLGSDSPPSHLLDIVLNHSTFLKPETRLTLFGTPDLFDSLTPPPSIAFYPVEETISMSDSPLTAIRKKKNSSLCIGIRLLKEKKIKAFISAGNTGALIGYAKMQLPTLPHIERPALLTLLPTKKNDLAVIDVGANTSYKSNHLIQFALMAIAYQKSRGIPLPKVGLLNIGSEACKGTIELQQAYHHLNHLSQTSNASFVFSGNIEGRDAFLGEIDVLVTDGFTGNVFLKTSEGIAAVILEELENAALEGSSSHLALRFKEIRNRLHYAEYPGAVLCGVDGIVIKCHGKISSQSLIRSIAIASRLIENSFLDQIHFLKCDINQII